MECRSGFDGDLSEYRTLVKHHGCVDNGRCGTVARFTDVSHNV